MTVLFTEILADAGIYKKQDLIYLRNERYLKEKYCKILWRFKKKPDLFVPNTMFETP